MKTDRFDDLWDRYRHGELGRDELTELEELLWSDKNKRRQFVENSLLEVQLHKAFATVMPVQTSAKSRAGRFRQTPYWIGAAALLILVVGGLFLIPFGRNGDGSGTPVVLSGQVRVNGAAVTQIPTDVPFQVGDKSATIRLSDGSRVELKPKSKASIRSKPQDARQVIELTQGTGKFEVKRGGGQFRVETPVGIVTALGTTFTVDLSAHRKKLAEMKKTVAVAVAEGEVRVDAGGKSTILGPGESFVFADDGEKNQIDNGQMNQNDDGQKNQNDDGQKNQNDDGQQNQKD